MGSTRFHGRVVSLGGSCECAEDGAHDAGMHEGVPVRGVVKGCLPPPDRRVTDRPPHRTSRARGHRAPRAPAMPTSSSARRSATTTRNDRRRPRPLEGGDEGVARDDQQLRTQAAHSAPHCEVNGTRPPASVGLPPREASVSATHPYECPSRCGFKPSRGAEIGYCLYPCQSPLRTKRSVLREAVTPGE